MCDSIADGGRRCAAHTRGPHLAALTRVAEAATADKSEARASGVVDVSAHASTRTGAQEIDTLIQVATSEGDHDQAAWLTTCRRLGDSQRQAANEIRAAIQSQRAQASLGTVLPGDVLHLTDEFRYIRTHIRRGTYVRVTGAAGDGAVTAEILQFRPQDTNRARRGPRDTTGSAWDATTGQVVTIPVARLRRPATNDDTATYYREHTVSWEGEYYTEQVADEICRAEPDTDFAEHAFFSPRERPPAER